MANINVKVELRSNIQNVLKQIGLETDRDIAEVCHNAIQYAQRLGPYEPGRMARRKKSSSVPKLMRKGKSNKAMGRDLAFVTGNLGRSIVASRVLAGKWQIGTETGYGAYVELGTKRAPAYPFLRPAIERSIEEMKRRK